MAALETTRLQKPLGLPGPRQLPEALDPSRASEWRDGPKIGITGAERREWMGLEAWNSLIPCAKRTSWWMLQDFCGFLLGLQMGI